MQAQFSNLRQRTILTSGVILLDTMSIVPGTVWIAGTDSSYFFVDYTKGTLSWLKKMPADSVIIQYRVFTFYPGSITRLYRFDSIQNNFMPITNEQRTTASSNETGIFNFGKLTYNGSLGRSISVGNNQDAVFNSQLNMQLSGYIGDSILLSAAITDNNIPIQPDGNTQRLNEFDQVLLQFRKKRWALDLGDIELRQYVSPFLQFYKRLQGAVLQQRLADAKTFSTSVTGSGAIAKGRFTRNIFNGQEGNQGPYRLKGPNNEFFFIVLANTERVFIDGIQLQRGEDQDYVINYNTAEITFTPRQMITKDKRIQVEFEYADRNYLNTLLFVSSETKIGNKLQVNLAIFNQADSRNAPINQTIDDAQRQFLADKGDNIEQAFYPSAQLDSFDINKILYKQIDTVYDGGTASIYVYSNDSEGSLFNLNFVDVGPNNGNYIQLFNAANGKVFKWVEPSDGKPQGNFEPAVFLITPKQLKIITASAQWKPDSATAISVDLGYSQNDINRFSSIDKANDNGLAIRFQAQRQQKISLLKESTLLSTKVAFEWVDSQFRTVERLRTVEFYRDWGLAFQPLFSDEKLPEFELLLNKNSNHQFRYKYASYIRGDGYKGSRHELQHHITIRDWQWQTLLQQTQFNTALDKGFFWKPSVQVKKNLTRLYRLSTGVNYAMEYNESKNIISDSVTPQSFGFDVLTAWIKTDVQKPNKLSVTYFTRSDLLPLSKELKRTDRSHNYSVQAELFGNLKHQWRLNTTFRTLQLLTNIPVPGLEADKTLLGRAEYLVREWNGFLTGQAFLEAGSGQEQRRDFSYLEVPPGTGQFAWNDYNNDGIQQLNEFETALFPDQAQFIRIFTPSNQFVKANYAQVNVSFLVNPSVFYRNVPGKKRNWLTNLTWQSALQRFLKIQSAETVAANPVKGNLADTSLINLRYFFNNTISYNRYSSIWGIDFIQLLNYNKALLTYGFETQQQASFTLKTRLNLAGKITVEILPKISRLQLTTPGFDNRNYDLSNKDIDIRFSYIQGTKLRISANYLSQQKDNKEIFGGEKAKANSLTTTVRYNAVNSTAFTASLTFTHIKYTGQTNTAVSYIMLDALLPGGNYLWNASVTKRLLQNLELNIEYQARKPSMARVIHTGTASIRALL
jgi:hypothetical protein